jgi:enamine deaminase RidA (YjgF/YER057c/UK114 family)
MITRHEKSARLSRVVVANGFAFLSGITAKDRSGGAKEQTADILEPDDVRWDHQVIPSDI